MYLENIAAMARKKMPREKDATREKDARHKVVDA